MATFKMIHNDDPNRYATVVEEGDIKSFRDNPEWEEVVVAEVKEEPKKKTRAATLPPTKVEVKTESRTESLIGRKRREPPQKL